MHVGTQRIDCLIDMLNELYLCGVAVPFHDADRREPWFDAVAQLVQALPRRDQQWAWVGLIANDLCTVMPGVSLPCAAAWVQARLGLKGDETQS